MHEPQITKRDDEEKFEKKAFKIAEELGDDYVSMLKEDFDGNLPKVLREYIAVKYPVLSEDAEKIFEEALSVARRIESNFSRASALRDIASGLAKVDVDRALSIAREIECKDDRAWALSNIASELAKVDVERALSVARGIESNHFRALALSSIASELAKVDVDRAKSIFEEALSVAMGIENDLSRASPLSAIASELAKVDVERALSFARRIKSDYWRADTLSSIASELAKVDVDRAKSIFEEALSVARGIESDSRASALRNIASELAKVDVERALSVAREIEYKSDRARALSNIAPELAKADVDRALSVARGIEWDYNRPEALSNIASELAKVDVERALSVARGIESNYFRASALQNIAPELAKVDVDRAMSILEEALSVARGIEKDSSRAEALRNIASEIAKVDVDRAKNIFEEAASVVREIEDRGDRAEALRNIASEIAKVDVDRAKNIFEEALSVAGGIEYEYHRVQAFSEIASDIAKADNEKILQEIPDSLIRRIIEGEWDAEQIKSTIKNYMEHGKDVSEIYSRYEELSEYLKPFGINEELPEMDYNHLDTWIKESERIINEMEQKKKEIEALKNRISELRDKAHILGIEITENIASIDEMKRTISEAEKRMESIKPSLSLNISGDITENLWSKAEIAVKNDGDINLENITIEFQTDVMDIRGSTRINSIKKGEEKRIPIRMKSRDAGYVPVEVLVKYRNPLTEKDEEMKLFPEIFVRSSEQTPSQTPTPATPIDIPQSEDVVIDIHLLEEYEHPKKIGGGSFGRVYRAKRKGDGTTIAIKVVKRWDKRHSRQFIKEVSIWENLAEMDRKHIVNIFDYSATPFGYIEMEYMEKSMDEMRFPLDPKVAARYMLDVAYALHTAHSQKPPAIHMDIKPSNIFIDSKGNAKLGDWGIAQRKYRDKDITSIGTLDFCSPEVLDPIEYGKPDEQSDIFSFGSTFYYILTGVKPFSGRNEEETMDNILSRNFVPKKPSEYNPDVPEAIDSIVMKCIEKSKEKRYAKITEVIFELSEHLGIKVDFSTGSSTYLMADALIYQAKNGNVIGTIEALKIIRKRAKTREFREKIDAIIRPLKQYLEEGNPRENSNFKNDFEKNSSNIRERILEISERFKMGR